MAANSFRSNIERHERRQSLRTGKRHGHCRRCRSTASFAPASRRHAKRGRRFRAVSSVVGIGRLLHITSCSTAIRQPGRSSVFRIERLSDAGGLVHRRRRVCSRVDLVCRGNGVGSPAPVGAMEEFTGPTALSQRRRKRRIGRSGTSFAAASELERQTHHTDLSTASTGTPTSLASDAAFGTTQKGATGSNGSAGSLAL